MTRPFFLQRPCHSIKIAFIGAILIFAGCAQPQLRYWAAPTVLPGLRPEMKTPGFWIAKMNAPDRIILDEPAIQALNRDIRDRLGLATDIAQLPPTLDRQELLSELTHWLSRFKNQGPFFLANGQQADPAFYRTIERRMNLAALPSSITLGLGIITTNTDQRLLPSPAPLYKKAYDIDFDRLQNNALDTGTPVAVLHQSLKGRWLYVKGPFSNGWIPSKNLAFCSQTLLAQMTKAPEVTIIRAKATLYRDRALTVYQGFARMGTRLLAAADPAPPGLIAVQLPTRQSNGDLKFQTGYITAREAILGHLDYTPRNIIQQAFEMLNTPYGWGGIQGEQDCSQFLQQVFACVGVRLPRNSAAQAQIGQEGMAFGNHVKEEPRRTRLLEKGRPGASLLYMKGHVMLYLGQDGGKPFAIHDIWGYRDPRSRGEDIRVVNRVAVTDLSLGRGSEKGSLLQRLQSLRLILFPLE